MILRHYLEQHSDALKCLLSHETMIEVLIEQIVDIIEKKGKVILAGNGGSAADAMHIAAEFVGRFRLERQPLPALALTTDLSAITAVGNDYSFDEIFSRQLLALGNEADLLICISTSGRSKNILRLIQAAKRKNIQTWLITGQTCPSYEEINILNITSTQTSIIQEIYLTLLHYVCLQVENRLFPQMIENA